MKCGAVWFWWRNPSSPARHSALLLPTDLGRFLALLLPSPVLFGIRHGCLPPKLPPWGWGALGCLWRVTLKGCGEPALLRESSHGHIVLRHLYKPFQEWLLECEQKKSETPESQKNILLLIVDMLLCHFSKGKLDELWPCLRGVAVVRSYL